MRLVFVHADHLAFEATAPASEAAAERADGVTPDRADGAAAEPEDGAAGDSEDGDGNVTGPGDAPAAGRMDDCVVAFVAVERADAVDRDAALADAAAEVRDVADHLDARRLVLYPAAHLSDDPADREVARAALRDLHVDLADFEVLRAPVDWYTAVEGSWKGHPHAVTSRRVGPGRDSAPPHAATRADADSDGVERAVAFPGGEVVDAREAAASDRIGDGLRALLDAGTGARTPDGSLRDRHLDLLADAGLADAPDRDGASGLRWSPRGTLVRDLLAERLADLAVAEGALPVETPAGDAGPTPSAVTGPTPSASANAVPAALRDLSLSESDLPVRLYDRGGGDATRRVGAPLAPEIHAVTRDVDAASAELRRWAGVCRQVADDLGLDCHPVIRTSGEFAEDDALVASVVTDLGDPALLERLPDRRGDRSVEVAFAVAEGDRNADADADRDADGEGDGDRGSRPVEVAAVRVDSDSAERSNVEYDDEGATCRPRVVRCLPVTGVERALAVLLERGAEADAPLPTWLAPTQVRFVPIGEEHVEFCDALADDFDAAGVHVRADVDARDVTVGERVARAERDRVPYLAVVGDREIGGDGVISVTVRHEATERTLTVAQLEAAVRADVGDRPTSARYLPRRVGEYPRFTGQ